MPVVDDFHCRTDGVDCRGHCGKIANAICAIWAAG
jgi:hypothetical protein